MIIALWIIDIVLALAYLAAGGTKVLRPTAKLATMMPWVQDFPAGVVKLIGTAEILGALGLVLPLATRIAPLLSPIAALCLAALMLGAIGVHIRRKESFVPALVLCVLAVVSAVLGFIAL
jgi:uncharacterized membrane protein YphA (DoxX/SURF4 family)